jgi:hypothetical protein
MSDKSEFKVEVDRSAFFPIGRVLQRGIGKQLLGDVILSVSGEMLTIDSDWGGGEIACTGAKEVKALLSAKSFCQLIKSRWREKNPSGTMLIVFRPELNEVAIDRVGVRAKFLIKPSADGGEKTSHHNEAERLTGQPVTESEVAQHASSPIPVPEAPQPTLPPQPPQPRTNDGAERRSQGAKGYVWYRCDRCNAENCATDFFVGTRRACTHCGREMVVPGAPTSSESQEGEPHSPEAPKPEREQHPSTTAAEKAITERLREIELKMPSTRRALKMCMILLLPLLLFACIASGAAWLLFGIDLIAAFWVFRALSALAGEERDLKEQAWKLRKDRDKERQLREGFRKRMHYDTVVDCSEWDPKFNNSGTKWLEGATPRLLSGDVVLKYGYQIADLWGEGGYVIERNGKIIAEHVTWKS